VYFSSNTSYSDVPIKADEMGRVCGRSGSKNLHSTGFDGETKGNRQLGRSGHRWKDIKLDVKETKWRGEAQTGSIYLTIWANSSLV